ncbi:iron-siderophore ABC transporter substrate-binding protein [Rhodococcus triatomae]|uniref:Iron complex transport system substrate-binding protein n=1 Tax=Rhodococcus triatomae TaxID=300028 RepID=A0A1G8DIU8_9NOCA|nr:iron-siderophore ABC transporter substrate-binding protein [Rhodococcus triatomae]QNG18419.1 iron-siderophore ABC transporter substrate-binding protein [Rhodococcus triatomae]QNG21911.1 iron-siderophore ABC transporter substrate-binding protein [Rhodococcus triatomae]SDH57596.1 iron complex transport system substrate-binding protein [Rhodococcus triatomae]
MVSRKWASLLVLFVVAVAGCSGSPTEVDGPDGAPDSAFPVTVAGKFGDVTVESTPTRVVAIGWGDAETALALGVPPVGASDWVDFGGAGVGPWAEGIYEDEPEIIGTLEPSYEQIAALAPDLILDTKSAGDRERYELLSKIAPTIGLPEGADNFKTTAEQQVELVSTALGMPEAGAELLADLDRRFADAAAAHPEFAGRSATVAARSGAGWGAYTADTERVQFVRKLGFVQNPTIDDLAAVTFSVPVAEENLGVLDADMVIVFPIQRTAREVEDTPLFQAIPAVQDGRYVVFDSPEVARSYSTNSVLSIRYALETVVPLLAERVEGR